MIKIIKPGAGSQGENFQLKCYRCDCLFSFGLDDVKHGQQFSVDICDWLDATYVDCPWCGTHVWFEKFKKLKIKKH